MLTKDHINAARKVYETYWDSYLKGEIETFASTLDNNFEMIGTSEGEVAHNKADGITFFKSQMQEMAGKAEMRNRQISAKPINGMVLINEHCDIYVLDEPEWTFYSKIRISTLLHETESGWKVIQQHGSLPDMRVGEGETLAIDKISRENIELRDAVKRRTAELESKNRELAIEAALENVRAVAMGMKKPEDMLDVCRAISDQLQQFGVGKIRNVQIAIIDENIGQYLCYQYFTPYDKTTVEKTEYLKSPVEHSMVKQMLASRDGYFIGKLSGKELEDFRIHRKEENHFPDPFLDKATELDYCFLSIGEGGLGLTVYQQMDDRVLTLFRRFHQVFSLAYQRFRDIQKAEAQAREAQIEAALERVRSKSLAMHHTSELQSVIHSVHEELLKLDLSISGGSFIAINSEIKDEIHCWGSGGTADTSNEVHIPYFDKPFYTRLLQGLKNGPGFFTEEYTREEKIEFFTFLFQHQPWSKLSQKEKKETLSAPGGYTRSCVVSKHTSIFIINHFGKPFSEDENAILRRFGKVFDQSYTRFLDLQKAEAQAREAQVEAALEKVRAQSMAMQHSNELQIVIESVYDRLVELGIEIHACTIITPSEHPEELLFWFASSAGQYNKPFHMPNNSMLIIREFFNGFKNKREIFSKTYSFQEKNKFFNYIFKHTDFKNIPENRKQLTLESKAYSICNTFMGYSGIQLNRYSDNPFSKQETEILVRFGKVFEQAYTRFLDLQKAEAQAREAQIEAALEKVRSRSLAMHKSGELNEVVSVLFERLKELQIPFTAVGIATGIEGSKDLNAFVCGQNEAGLVITNYRLPYFDNPVPKDLYSALEKQLDYYVGHYSKEEKDAFYNYVIEHTAEFRHLPEDIKRMIFESQNYTISMVAVKNAVFNVNDFEGKVLAEDEVDIIKRFARVFEQAYIRFLDLQKAEAQAREAQIEAALEKVRSRSLAMHKSKELIEVDKTIIDQIKVLGIQLFGVGIHICRNNEPVSEAWMGDPMEGGLFGGDRQFSKVIFEHTHDGLSAKMYRGWKEGATFLVETIQGESLREHMGYMRTIVPDPTIFENAAPPEFLIYHFAYFSHGFFVFVSTAPCQEDHPVFIRFARVFEQAYTRFLDLQKAEAQAREAEIQLALERVRAKTMAMKTQSDLHEIIELFGEQLKAVKIRFDNVTFIEGAITKNRDWDLWSYVSAKKSLARKIHIPYLEIPYFTKTAKAVEEYETTGRHLHVKTFTNQEKNEFLDHYWKHVPEPPKEIVDLVYSSPGSVIVDAFFEKITVSLVRWDIEPYSEEELDIFERFGREFRQTYIRFLDLQKSEAQAREAQIELSLERIRSQVTAMQESSDLLDIVVTMRSEFVKLGHEAHYFWHMRWLPDRYDKAMTSGDGTKIGMVITLPRHIHGDIPLVADWEKTKEATVVLAMEVEAAVDYVHKMITLGDFEQVDPQAPTLDDIRHIGGLTFVMARTTHGEIGYSLPGVVTDPPKNAVDTLIRFAGVFDLAYKRFEDLKAAERQHREAQIELALERVRARTMAMQSSEELADAAFVLFEQLRALGGNLWGTGFGLCQEKVEKDEFWFANENGVFPPVTIPNTTDPAHKQMYQGWGKKNDFLTIEKSGAALKSHYDYMLSLPEVRPFFQKILDEGLSFPEKQQWNAAYFSKGYLLIITLEPYPEPEIFKRFAKVFEQTYTRFLDLQRAEAQAREAEIQLALERVRARSLAMHRSEELADISLELVKQVQTLGMESWFCAFNIYDDDPRGSVEWGSNGKGTFPQYRTPREGVFLRYFEAGQRGETLLVNEIGEEACPAHYEYLCGLPGVGEQLLQMKEAGIPFPTSQIDHVAFFKYGYVLFITYEPAPESHDIFKRFAKVFEQTYTRFLDLQKAEAQAREAQIEAALERVRSRTMAMQSSDELSEAATEMFSQIKSLGLNPWSCGFNIFNEDKTVISQWVSSGDGRPIEPFDTPTTEGIFKRIVEDSEKDEPLRIEKMEGKKLEDTYNYMASLPRLDKIFEELDAAGIALPKSQVDHAAYFKHGYLMFITFDKVPEFHSIFKRFAKVFEQTYTRFLDLQKAEAQAKEARIEAALERVRSRTMGMQKAEELGDVAIVLFQELNALVDNLWTCGFVLCEKDRKEDEWWLSLDNGLIEPFSLPNVGDYAHETLYEGWKKGDAYRTVTLEDEQLHQHYDWLMKIPIAEKIFEEMEASGIPRPNWQRLHAAYFKTGYLVIITEVPCEEEDIFKRFAQVFDLTYTRFLDLQKAEMQAREAQIEAALEKVRSRSLAMQSPDELIEVAQLLREEMGALGVEELETSSIYIHNQNSGKTQCWFTIKDTHSGKGITDRMTMDLEDTWVGKKMLDFYRSDAKQTSILMQGEHRVEWIRYCGEKSTMFTPEDFYGDTIPERSYHLYKFSNGYIGAASPGKISTESWDLLKRATAVFSFAYTRFQDLQRAEVRALEARIELALERIRAQVASMQESSDLFDVVVNMRKEFITLGHEADYFWHMRWLPESYEMSMTSEDGNRIGMVISLPKFVHDEIPGLAEWEKGDDPVYVLALDAEGGWSYIENMNTHGSYELADPNAPGKEDIEHIGGLTFIMARTTHGEIGYSLPGEVHHPPKESLDTLVRFAGVFDLAYKRFEDLKAAEHQAKLIREERDRLEVALKELRATQEQLVQQEKLASLGQLTAGIAHEIKNPLNFVNNFSEVSMEMIEEIIDARLKTQDSRPKTEAEEIEDEILEDIKANLEKIYEHGSRANGIVTSMLQHSRGGSGQMEPTDLNALIKEYVNLSFHGMRAGKNPIDVDIILELDTEIKQVSLIKEDFTRVIINLCNNAFDAMRSKVLKKQDLPAGQARTRTKTQDGDSKNVQYFPKLSVSTLLESNHILVSVEDNGPGISDDIKDKILQPFFTTKKGTEGTGLGLSITHDIVKAHGGQLQVESSVDVGSTFTIQLPKSSL